jgi:cell division protein FtsB
MGAGGLGGLFARAALPAACLLVIGYFGSHALLGNAGVLSRGEIAAEKSRLTAERAALEARNADLQRKIALLDPAGADPDFADELVRRHLGVMRPDEILVPLPPEN